MLQHINSTTEQIIEQFASCQDSSDDGCLGDSPVNVFNCDYYRDPPEHYDHNLEDDIDENTDTDDGVDDIIDIIGSNTKLIAFLHKQRNTIARLRARIDRLSTLVKDLTPQIHDSARIEIEGLSLDTSFEHANVLVDTNTDLTFLIRPNCDLVVDTAYLYSPQIKQELDLQLARIHEVKNNPQSELWMYFDSGASRSVISTISPVREYLKDIKPTYGSCSIGDGTPLTYIETGKVMDNLEITVVKDLKYDLFSSVYAAKQGLTSVIDFDLQTGKNNSYTIDKITGTVTPLVERCKGILELPLHLMLQTGACLTAASSTSPLQTELPPNIVSMFWHYYGDASFDPATRESNNTEYSLFTFDILKSLNSRERDFLIHARLGHLPRQKIFQMIKNGTTGIGNYSGKFQELRKPCMQAKHRAKKHGHEHKRHPNGRPGEHLHSDLAVLSTIDLNGNKYVLTVVDEISHEIVIALLKRKTADDVHRVCQRIQLSIAARTGNKLLTWQFDRGTEFLNSTFDKWFKTELGVIQRFSNVEHPWENGMAERSFQTIFSLTRSLLKHADLPDRLWGKAILHSVYLCRNNSWYRYKYTQYSTEIVCTGILLTVTEPA